MKQNLSLVAGVAAGLGLLLTGCGGSGGGNNGSGGGGGGNTTNLAAQFDIQEVSGTTVAAITASATPQTIQLSVKGAVQSFANTVAPFNVDAGTNITLIKQGTKLLNIQIVNPDAGLAFADSAIHAPITASGTLTTNIIGDIDVVNFTTPPATWNGFQFPNGLSVNAGIAFGHEGNAHASGDFTMPITPLSGSTVVQANGTMPIPYAIPGDEILCNLTLKTADATFDFDADNPLAPSNGTLTGTWQASWSATPKTFTYAALIARF